MSDLERRNIEHVRVKRHTPSFQETMREVARLQEKTRKHVFRIKREGEKESKRIWIQMAGMLLAVINLMIVSLHFNDKGWVGFGYFVLGAVGAGFWFTMGIKVAFWIWPPSLPGHCWKCSYDLRATPDRCPECGENQ